MYTISALLIQKSIVIFEEAGGKKVSISVLKLRYFSKTFYAEVEVFIEKPVKCFFGLDRNMSRKTS